MIPGGIYLSPDAISTTALILGVWTLLAIAVGFGFGKAVSLADEAADDATWLADQPTEVLSQAEVDAQFREIGSKTWWA